MIELLRKAQVEGDVDFLKEAVRVMVQSLIDHKQVRSLEADPYERDPSRLTYHNGTRLRRGVSYSRWRPGDWPTLFRQEAMAV